jgi:signal transduction histidine kinase
MIVAAQVPVVVACPHVSARRLGLFAAAATASTLCSVAFARHLRLPGAPVAVPHWLPDVVVFAFLPVLAGLVGLICRQNQLRHFAAVAALRESRARVLAATDDARRRIARDLHDGAQQHLIGAGLRVDLLHDVLAGARSGTDAERLAAAAALVEELADINYDALTALRRLAAGVYATSLTDYGLAAALRSALVRFPGTRLLAAELPRLAPTVEAALYFSCLEAIQNAAKHAGPGATTTVALATVPRSRARRAAPSEVRWTVADDGVGFTRAGPDPGAGIGFHTMADRLEAVGGRLEVRSSPGQGTVVEGSVPLHHPPSAGPGAR